MDTRASQWAEFDRYADQYHAELSHVCRRLVDPHDNYFVDLKCAELELLISEQGKELATLTVADVGCGPGDFERRLAAACAQLYAVDVSYKMLQIASRTALLPHGGYICADSLHLPLPDHSVDLAFASCLLHHMSGVPPAVVVTELSRICRPGGLVVCFEHNPLNPVTQLVVRTTPIDRTAVLLPPKTLRQAFLRAGLHNVDCRFILFGPKPIDRQLMRWRPWLYRVPLGAQYLVYGRKGNGCYAARPA